MGQVCVDQYAFCTIVMAGVLVAYYCVTTMQRMGDKCASLRALNRASDSARDVVVENSQVAQHSGSQIASQAAYGTNPYVSGLVPINIPTRGYEQFKTVGFLNDADRVIPLIGRRIHSNRFEYHTFHHKNPYIKIPIGTEREIDDGQEVTVGAYPGATFKATLYNDDAPRYLPW